MQKSILGSLANISRLPKYVTPNTYISGTMINRSVVLPPSVEQNIDRNIENENNNKGGFVLPINQIDTDMELMAVPKKRQSYTRSRKRNSAKKFENIHHHTVCPKCQSIKLRHHLCMNCIKKI